MGSDALKDNHNDGHVGPTGRARADRGQRDEHARDPGPSYGAAKAWSLGHRSADGNPRDGGTDGTADD